MIVTKKKHYTFDVKELKAWLGLSKKDYIEDISVKHNSNMEPDAEVGKVYQYAVKVIGKDVLAIEEGVRRVLIMQIIRTRR